MDFQDWYKTICQISAFSDEDEAELYFDKIDAGLHSAIGDSLYRGLFEEGNWSQSDLDLQQLGPYSPSLVEEGEALVLEGLGEEGVDIFHYLLAYIDAPSKSDKFRFLLLLSKGLAASRNQAELEMIRDLVAVIPTPTQPEMAVLFETLSEAASVASDRAPSLPMLVPDDFKNIRSFDSYSSLKSRVEVSVPKLSVAFP